MKINYIYHSGFAMELKACHIIFDYYKKKPYNENMDFDFDNLLNSVLSSGKKIYVFASHSHSDHFNPEIIKWKKICQDITYILSSDIHLYSDTENCVFLDKDKEYKDNIISVNTFGSTDDGISFVIKVENRTIFHAGDLNWWKWNDDTPEEERCMEDAFKHEIAKIKSKITNIDIAFFPVDKRLEENYLCGGEYFIQELSPHIFIPMHLWDKYGATIEFKNYMTDKYPDNMTEIIVIDNANQTVLQ